MQNWKPWGNFFNRSFESFNSKSESQERSYHVFQKLFFIKKTFLWTRRMQFGQPTRKFSTEGPGSFGCNSEWHGGKHVPWKRYFFFKTMLRAHWEQFWQTLRIVLAKSPKLTNQVLKPRKKFPDDVLLDTYYAV